MRGFDPFAPRKRKRLVLSIPAPTTLLIGVALSLDMQRCCGCRKDFEIGEELSRCPKSSLLFCHMCRTYREEQYQ